MELTQRIATLEALLDVTHQRRLTLSADEVEQYRERLISVLASKRRWLISDVSSMIGDIARLSPETATAVGKTLLCSALERSVVEARLLRHTRSEIYAGRAQLIIREIGVQPAEAEHLASDW